MCFKFYSWLFIRSIWACNKLNSYAWWRKYWPWASMNWQQIKLTRFVPSLWFDNLRKLKSLTNREENWQTTVIAWLKYLKPMTPRPMTHLTSTGIFLWLFLVLPQPHSLLARTLNSSNSLFKKWSYMEQSYLSCIIGEHCSFLILIR